MKRFFSLLSFICILTISCQNKATFNTGQDIVSFVDDAILVEGMDIQPDRDYLARINGRAAEIRYINDGAIEVIVPDNAESGPLRIIDKNREFTIADIEIKRLYLSNNTRKEIREFSIGQGRDIGLLKEFDDYKVIDMVYAPSTHELIASIQHLSQPTDIQLFTIHTETKEERFFPLAKYSQLVTTPGGQLYAYSDNKIYHLNPEDGSVIQELVELEGYCEELVYLQTRNSLRSYYTETVDGINYHFYEEYNIDDETLTKSEQEFPFQQVKERDEDELIAFIPYTGIIRSDFAGNTQDYILMNSQYASYFDLLKERNLIISIVRELQTDGTNPYFIIVYNELSKNENRYQISPYVKVLIGE